MGYCLVRAWDLHLLKEAFVGSNAEPVAFWPACRYRKKTGNLWMKVRSFPSDSVARCNLTSIGGRLSICGNRALVTPADKASVSVWDSKGVAWNLAAILKPS
jgi:hypothetical protein